MIILQLQKKDLMIDHLFPMALDYDPPSLMVDHIYLFTTGLELRSCH
jgi:hypothetical protein